MHYRAGQNGKTWLLILPKQTGKPEGSVLALAYPNSTGWVGFFLMNAAFRGQGLGRELWKEMERTFRNNATFTIGLDGVEEQVKTYERRGFVDVARIHVMTREPLIFKPFAAHIDLEGAVELQDLREIDPIELAKLDLEHTGLDRSAYWASTNPISRAGRLGGFAIKSNDKVTGFIYVRRSEHGHRFGPLYAETYAQAKQLLHKAMNDVVSSEGYVAEIFGSNAEGKKVFEELGWKYADVSYHRMWLGRRVPRAQNQGGKGVRGMYAVFDAACG